MVVASIALATGLLLALTAGGLVGIADAAGPRVVMSDGTRGSRLSPFPDDRFTVPDPSSLTGRRLALPLPATTDLERPLHTELERLDGFGALAPITVTFGDDLDVGTITDASVLVVNAEPGSRRFGERAPLDLGGGSYPTDLGTPVSFYPRDALAGSGDLVFPPGNPGSHYEASSRTVILRPLVPLEEGAMHVVVLTDRLRGPGGEPVKPPAGYSRPTASDAALGAALGQLGLGLDVIRYQWAFTTGTPTRELRAVADGLDGAGPLPQLAGEPPTGPDGTPTVLGRDVFAPLLVGLGDLLRLSEPSDPAAGALANLLQSVELACLSHLAGGAVRGPELRVTARGTFELDLVHGTAGLTPGGSRVTFLVAVPRPCAENGYARPPYSIVLFGHGNGRSRLDGLGVAGTAVANGWAVLAFDQVGHGPDDALVRLPGRLEARAQADPTTDRVIRAAIAGLAAALREPLNPESPVELLVRQLLCRSLHPLLCDGRAVDVDGDGVTDSGATFFVPDAFRTRDIVRQSVVDAMVLVRVFRQLGTDRNGNGRLDPEEGDLDGDGVLDLGGPRARLAFLGISEGGIVGAVLRATDPTIERADLMVPGGGLTDIVVTTARRELSGGILRPVFGAVIVGNPRGTSGVDVEADGTGPVGVLATRPGGKVMARNLRSGVRREALVETDGGFRLHLPVDPGDPVELKAPGHGAGPGALTFTAPAAGLGFERSTPAFREWLGLAALALEPADPVSYAPHWGSSANGPAGVLIQLSLGDRVVPTFTGAALGRAGGLVSAERNALLIREGVLAGGTGSNVDRRFGVESARDEGIRFFGINSHDRVLFPGSLALDYARAIQRQAFTFLATGLIDDSNPVFDVVLPP